MGYFNGELRFWLGWAQEVAGDHAAAQEGWRQARNEHESFLQEQPENFLLIGDLAPVNMGLGDKAAALALTERAIALIPIEKDADYGPIRLRSSPVWRRAWGNPIAPLLLYRNFCQYPTLAHWLRTSRSLPRCSGSIRCLIRFGMIRASRNSSPRPRRTMRSDKVAVAKRKRSSSYPPAA